ncbi:hypothetical protein P43SY_004726 [Pythium insidiosum]|uniref:M96 mating-specific protein family n=1 Tax=Pythium insidiosum TaxID=114742 RepID=A0AAD5Q5C6_PYTIN|nr:hypothetical protein P43SY_004726 [Pythium insidiosum]
MCQLLGVADVPMETAELHTALEFADELPWLDLEDCEQPPSCLSTIDALMMELQPVQELESQLADLQERTHAVVPKSNKLDPREEHFKELWATMAKRQFEQRQQAELENAKLREMLQDQIRAAKSLEKLLRKQNNVELKSPKAAVISGVRSLKDASALDKDYIREDLLASLESQYRQLGSVLSDPRMLPGSAPLRDIAVRSNPVTGTFVEMVDTRVLPFKIHLSAEAVWRHMASDQLARIESMHEDVVEVTQDTIQKAFFGSMDVGSARGSVRGKVVFRRFTEATRVVLVWCALADPLEIGDISMNGILMRHMGWTVLEELSGRTSATLIRSYQVATPMFLDGDVVTHAQKVGALTTFSLHAIKIRLDTDQQCIENWLLQEAMLSE